MGKPAAHSSVGASRAHRYLNCPGSTHLEAKFPDSSSVYADEGSVAHRLLEKCLLSKTNASEHIGKKILLETGKSGDVTEEMAEAVQVAIDEVNRILRENPGSVLEVEKKVHLDWLHKSLWGTVDIRISCLLDKLYIIDYKHGAGKVVDVQDNVQIMFYGLAGLGQPPKKGSCEDYEVVIPGIIQPRAVCSGGPVRFADPIDVNDLRKWGNEVLVPGVKKTLAPNAPLKAGDWCQFCRAMPGCPQMHRITQESAIEIFSETPHMPDVNMLTQEQVVKILEVSDMICDFVTSVKQHAHGLAMAGNKIPGHKLVLGRPGNRSWKDEAEAEKVLSKELGEDAYEPKSLKSVAQIEKVLKKVKSSIDLESHTTRPEGKPQLVKASDPKPEYIPLSAEDVFKEIE